MIRHWTARDWYKESIVHEKMGVLPGHVYLIISVRARSLLSPRLPTDRTPEHCFDMLRQHLMCQPSIAFWTYKWPDEEDPAEPNDDMHFPHACVNWDSLYSWADERSFDVHDGLVLKPNGKSTSQPEKTPMLT